LPTGFLEGFTNPVAIDSLLRNGNIIITMINTIPSQDISWPANTLKKGITKYMDNAIIITYDNKEKYRLLSCLVFNQKTKNSKQHNPAMPIFTARRDQFSSGIKLNRKPIKNSRIVVGIILLSLKGTGLFVIQSLPNT
jgi:hypothetical protein